MSRADFDRAIRRAESPELWWGGAPAAERETVETNEKGEVTMQTEERGTKSKTAEEITVTMKAKITEDGFDELEAALFAIEDMAQAIRFTTYDEATDEALARVLLGCTTIIGEKTGAIRTMIRHGERA